jgi:hypothetical protein
MRGGILAQPRKFLCFAIRRQLRGNVPDRVLEEGGDGLQVAFVAPVEIAWISRAICFPPRGDLREKSSCCLTSSIGFGMAIPRGWGGIVLARRAPPIAAPVRFARLDGY